VVLRGLTDDLGFLQQRPPARRQGRDRSPPKGLVEVDETAIPPRPALGASPLHRPQTSGTRHLPRAASQAPAILPRRSCLPLQSPPLPICRLPKPARHRRQLRMLHLQNGGRTESNGISRNANHVGTIVTDMCDHGRGFSPACSVRSAPACYNAPN
jgi:hypothetical protein